MIAALVISFAVSAFIYFRYLTSSGDIDQYSSYYINDSATPGDGAVKVTFLGTTSLLFDDGDTQVMTDGFLTRPSLWKVATSRIRTDTAVVDAVFSRLKIDRLKGLFVGHSHYDHAFDIGYMITKTNAKLYGSRSTLNIGIGGGLRTDQMVLYEPGKVLHFGKFRVTILNSKHSPAKSFNDDIGQMITAPLVQPAKAREYHEGGSYDILIEHGGRTILIKPSANYVAGALDNVQADVVFWSTGTLGMQDAEFKNAYYDQTIGKVKPKLLIPIHWDNFFVPLSDHLKATIKAGDNLTDGFEFVIARTEADGIEFRILQGYQSILLFSGEKK